MKPSVAARDFEKENLKLVIFLTPLPTLCLNHIKSESLVDSQ